MPRKTTTGQRRPMSEEAKARIAAAVKKAAAARGNPKGPHVAIPATPAKALEILALGSMSFPDSLWENHLTNTPLDYLFTPEGGIPKATNWILVGDPGVGKSTVGMDTLAALTEQGVSCLFVSAEMTRVDLAKYVQRFPRFGSLQTLFLGEFLDHNPKAILEQALNLGFDVVLIDSFVEVQECVQESLKITSVAAQKWLVDLMKSHNMGANPQSKFTTFLCIQQVTKDGVFLGSNRLKHATTGMLEMRFDEEDKSITFLEFTKNRRGSIGQRLLFDLRGGGEISYTEQTEAPEEIPMNDATTDAGLPEDSLEMRALARLFPN